MYTYIAVALVACIPGVVFAHGAHEPVSETWVHGIMHAMPGVGMALILALLIGFGAFLKKKKQTDIS